MIVYKVGRRTTYSDVYRSCTNNNLIRVRHTRHKLRVPSRQYRIGHMTYAYPGSLGIFCFYDESRAKSFSYNVCGAVTLKVEGLGGPTEPKMIDGDFENPLYGSPGRMGNTRPPLGTVCFPRVRTLEVLPR